MTVDRRQEHVRIVGDLLLQWLHALTEDNELREMPHPSGLCGRDQDGGHSWVAYDHPGLDGFPRPWCIGGESADPGGKTGLLADSVADLERQGLIRTGSRGIYEFRECLKDTAEQGEMDVAQLTDRGYEAASVLASSPTSQQRQHGVAAALLRVISGIQYAGMQQTNIILIYLHEFLGDNYDLIDSPPASIYELFTAKRHLQIHGLITVEPAGLAAYPYKSAIRLDRPASIVLDRLIGKLTQAGIMCVEKFGGDIAAAELEAGTNSKSGSLIDSASRMASDPDLELKSYLAPWTVDGRRHLLGELLLQWLFALTEDDTLRIRRKEPPSWYCQRNDPANNARVTYGFMFIDSFPCPGSIYGEGVDRQLITEAVAELRQQGLIVSANVTGELCARLTDAGYKKAKQLALARRSPEREQEVRRVTLSWIGQQTRRTHLKWFLEWNDDLNAPPASIYEAFDAIQRLEIEGLISVEPDKTNYPNGHAVGSFKEVAGSITTENLQAQLTADGIACLEDHGGDFAAMRKARLRGDDRRTYVHGPTANLVVGDGQVHQQASHFTQQAGEVVDIAALVRFADAVAQALPALALPTATQQTAKALTVEITSLARQPQPDHPKLRALGSTLRAVLEGAAGNALGTALLSLWS